MAMQFAHEEKGRICIAVSQRAGRSSAPGRRQREETRKSSPRRNAVALTTTLIRRPAMVEDLRRVGDGGRKEMEDVEGHVEHSAERAFSWGCL